MKFQKIKDERLIIKNLQNIRLAYVLQTLGIVGLLGYDVISRGLGSITGNPLWIVLVASTVVLALIFFSSDERLAFKNLQKIRIAFAIQMLGIVGILGDDLVTEGMNGMQENPLWFLFIISTLILVLLSMNIRVDYEDNKKDPGKGLAVSIVALLLLSIAVSILTVFFNEASTFLNGILIGCLLFACGFLSFIFLYGLRKSKE